MEKVIILHDFQRCYLESSKVDFAREVRTTTFLIYDSYVDVPSSIVQPECSFLSNKQTDTPTFAHMHAHGNKLFFLIQLL